MDATTLPRVSVLLPVFDAESTLAACLHSIERQTEPRWECIIVDDGSTDGTRACAERFAGRDGRFVIVSAAHQGLVAALNVGIEHCRGRFVARMDADDLMRRDRLAKQAHALENADDLAAVGSHVRLFPRRHLQTGLRAYERWLNSIDSAHRLSEEAFVECPVAHPTLMIRRDTLAELGYRDQGWPEDYDLILRLLGHGRAVGMVAQRLLCWRDGPRRLWRTASTYTLERFTACKAAFLAAGFLNNTGTYVLWGYGETGKALRRALLDHGKQPSHVVELNPRRLGKVIHGAKVVTPDALLSLPRRPIVVSVAGEEARRQIRRAMKAMGLCETRDFICTA